jgi:transposase
MHMGRPYSLDLRERVIDVAAASSPRQAARRFGVGAATVTRWMATLAQTGKVAARPQGRPRRSKLDPHEPFLRGLIDTQNDITLNDMCARLRVERGLTVRPGTLWHFLDARNLSYQKRSRSPLAAALGSESALRDVVRE